MRIAITLATMLVAGAVYAHSWYDPACCSGYDCAPIPADTVSVGADGSVRVRLTGSDHHMIPAGVVFDYTFPAEKVRWSKDAGNHACISSSAEMGVDSADGLRGICLYLGGAV